MSTPLENLNQALADADASLATALTANQADRIAKYLAITGGTFGWTVTATGNTLLLTFTQLNVDITLGPGQSMPPMTIASLTGALLQTPLAALLNIAPAKWIVTGPAGGPVVITLIGA